MTNVYEHSLQPWEQDPEAWYNWIMEEPDQKVALGYLEAQLADARYFSTDPDASERFADDLVEIETFVSEAKARISVGDDELAGELAREWRRQVTEVRESVRERYGRMSVTGEAHLDSLRRKEREQRYIDAEGVI